VSGQKSWYFCWYIIFFRFSLVTMKLYQPFSFLYCRMEKRISFQSSRSSSFLSMVLGCIRVVVVIVCSSLPSITIPRGSKSILASTASSGWRVNVSWVNGVASFGLRIFRYSGKGSIGSVFRDISW